MKNFKRFGFIFISLILFTLSILSCTKNPPGETPSGGGGGEIQRVNVTLVVQGLPTSQTKLEGVLFTSDNPVERVSIDVKNLSGGAGTASVLLRTDATYTLTAPMADGYTSNTVAPFIPQTGQSITLQYMQNTPPPPEKVDVTFNFSGLSSYAGSIVVRLTSSGTGTNYTVPLSGGSIQLDKNAAKNYTISVPNAPPNYQLNSIDPSSINAGANKTVKIAFDSQTSPPTPGLVNVTVKVCEDVPSTQAHHASMYVMFNNPTTGWKNASIDLTKKVGNCYVNSNYGELRNDTEYTISVTPDEWPSDYTISYSPSNPITPKDGEIITVNYTKGEPPPPLEHPELSFSTINTDMQTTSGNTINQTITIQNKQNAASGKITIVSLTPQGSPLSITQNNCSAGQILTAGTSCTIEVSLNAQTVSNSAGTLQINYSSLADAPYTLTNVINYTVTNPPPPGEERHPFPQAANLAGLYKIKPTGVSQTELNKAVKDYYDYWKGRYLDCIDMTDNAQHQMCRIKYGPSTGSTWSQDRTVSEQQGYGMLFTVLMAGYDANAQSNFDKLWYFVAANPTATQACKPLMNWQIFKSEGVNNPSGKGGGAFDGDADIILALIMADVQWGSSGSLNYKNLAQRYLTAFTKCDVGADSKLPLLGEFVYTDPSPTLNQFSPRSSDFMLDSFRAFQKFNTDAYNPWSSVIAQVNEVIQTTNNGQNNNANSPPVKTGLLPDFYKCTDCTLVNFKTNIQPVPKDTKNWLGGGSQDTEYFGAYYSNAVRVPLRLGIDAILNSTVSSLNQVKSILAFAKSKVETSKTSECGEIPIPCYTEGGERIFNFNSFKSGWWITGEPVDAGIYTSPIYIAPLGVAAMAASDQNWLDAIYLYANQQRKIDYYFQNNEAYGDSLTLFSLFVMTGNYWSPYTFQAEQIKMKKKMHKSKKKRLQSSVVK